MTIYEFAVQLFDNCIDPASLIRNGYTLDDATADLENFRADGWDMPEDITPEALVASMNDIIKEAREDWE